MISTHLDAAVESGDWAGVDALLAQLDDGERAAATTWYSRGGRVRAAAAADTHFFVRPGEPETADFAAVAQLLAARLAPTPERAAGWFGWQGFSGVRTLPAAAAVLAALAARGRDWCERFVAAGNRLRIANRWHGDGADAFSVLMPLVEHFDLPLPLDGNYVRGWVAYYARKISGGGWVAFTERHPGQPAVPRPRVGQVWLTASGGTRLDERLLESTPLTALLADDPVLEDAFDAALAVPGLFGGFITSFTGAPDFAGWQAPAAFAELVRTKRMDRAHVVRSCLEALTRRDNASTQRAIAQILTALELTPADVEGQLPLLQGTLAMSHGSVTAALLPVTLASAQTADDVDEVAATIFSRPEKKQQSDLLKALTAPDASARFGAEGVTSGLRRAAASTDLRIAQRAAAVLGASAHDAAGEPRGAARVDGGLWNARPEPLVPRRLAPIEPTAAAVSRWESAQLAAPTLTGEAELLATLVAFVQRDPSAARGWLAARPPGGNSHLLELARNWSRSRWTTSEFITTVHLVHEKYGSKQRYELPNRIGHRGPSGLFTELHHYESLVRLGTVRELLSTPSLDDGTLLFEDLLARVRAAGRAGYAQLDLMQALVRLEPVDPGRADELRGLSLPERSGRRGVLGLRQRSRSDGARIIADWIAAGGARYPGATLDADGMRVAGVQLPIDLDAVPMVPPFFLAGRSDSEHRAVYSWDVGKTDLVALPHWSEAFAVSLDRGLVGSKGLVPWVAAATRVGLAGRAVHTVVARAISHPDASSRLLGAEAVLNLIGRGQFDPSLFTEACRRLLAAGQLPLARTSAAFEQVIQSGGMSSIWPTVLDLADAACAADKLPSGAAELFAVIRRFGAAAPDGGVTDALRRFAQRPGSTKANIEARAVLAGARS